MHYCSFRYSLVVVVLCMTLQAAAQYNSPFSRFGLGNKIDNAAINYRGTGGAGIADNEGNIINILNPATFAGLRFATLQFGLNGSINAIETNTSSANAGKVDLGYLQVAFPLSKTTGTSFGLMTDYQTRYTLRSTEKVPGIDSSLTTFYNGKGTISKVYWGIGQKYKNWSVGINAFYLFGNTVHVIDKIFTSNYINNYYFQDSTHYGGFGWQAGALYEKRFKGDKYKLNIGANYNATSVLKSSSSKYNAGYSYTSNGFGIYDTVYNSTEAKNTTTIPERIGVGISLMSANNWRLNLDFNTQNNSGFRDNGVVDSVTNSWMTNVGFAFVPDAGSFQNYWKGSEYRFGLFYGKDYIKVFNEIPVYGVSLGTGLPLRKTARNGGQVNVSFQIGRRGSLANNKVNETFFRVGLGLTFNDKWFIKRKYD